MVPAADSPGDSEGIYAEFRESIMSRDRIVWAALALAGLSLVLVVVNIGLSLWNQQLQFQVAERQQFIGEQTEYRRIGEALVRSLTTTAASSKDPQLAALIQRHGIAAPGAGGGK